MDLILKKGVNLNASILDVAPTVYALLGLPLPPDLDGKVLEDMLELKIDGYQKNEKEKIKSVIEKLDI